MNIYKILFFFPLICKSFIFFNNRKLNTNLQSKKINEFNQHQPHTIYKPKGENQEKYFKYLNDAETKLIITLGPAGTGKTLFACQKAIQQMLSFEIEKIIITRPVVTVEEDIGFLPGNIIKKMDPWTKPIFDIFLEYYSKTKLDQLLNNGKIEICPLAFMRGRTFKNAFIIADEMQNSSPNQMKMLTTRLGENSKIVITGDLQQSDLHVENGLHNLIEKINNYKIKNETKLIKILEMTNDDIERSEIVRHIIDIYDFKDKKNATLINEIIVTNKSNIINTNNITTNNITINNNTKYQAFNSSKMTDFINKKLNENDAALIPKKYMTKYDKNNDIFFNKLDF